LAVLKLHARRIGKGDGDSRADRTLSFELRRKDSQPLRGSEIQREIGESIYVVKAQNGRKSVYGG